ncbi:MAG TPA: hypothetical protein VMM84_17040 [Pyrinomonadaceae bacterium]|nr:hypothetical protein [Pyrinomonadaceae bacterium]
MRNKSAIDSLFSKTRRDILAATYGQPERQWYLSELAEHLKTIPSSLQRELNSLASSGILRTWQDGRRTYYQAESDSPIFEELRGIVVKTLGITDALTSVITKVNDRIACAFLYGSAARRQERPLSDVDLMIVGGLGLSELSPLLRPLEKKLNREINVTCYSPEEFSKKVKAQNHFLTSVLSEEKVFLKGSEDELESLAGEPDSAAA